MNGKKLDVYWRGYDLLVKRVGSSKLGSELLGGLNFPFWESVGVYKFNHNGHKI